MDCVQRAGHAPPLQNERSVTWRSDLFIYVSFTNTNMRTPGPGPQARCGKGVWSPEDQGDRCRVPRSFGPSGAGGEPLKLLQSTQRDDLPTKGTRPAGLHLIRPFGPPSPLGEGSKQLLSDITWERGQPFPSKGKAKRVRYSCSIQISSAFTISSSAMLGTPSLACWGKKGTWMNPARTGVP